MTTYHVFQPQLSDEQITLVNSKGWNASVETALYVLMTGPTAPGDLGIIRAVRNDVFVRGWQVDAETLEEVFTLANYMPANGTATKTHPRAKSMSVGDLVVWADADGTVHGARCASFGFDTLNGFISRTCHRAATETKEVTA